GDEGGVAVGDRHVGGGVVHFLVGQHFVTQRFEGLEDDDVLEQLLGDRTFDRLHLHALAGQGVGVRGQANGGDERGGKRREACADGGAGVAEIHAWVSSLSCATRG